ncbi:MAG: transposase [Deltaproteobacteria bacterium]|nr:transposase [Deltaproteobacteria bacterium]
MLPEVRPHYKETQTQCYAWALIPNHFHLLLRTGPTELSKVMRRLMTGYAVTFNKRHKRSGHLFQNRYKSIICEEDPYLLELVRYVHLNPLRAKLVQDLNELDKYPWAGHSAILGNGKNPLAPPEQAKELNKRKEPNEPTKSLAEKTIEDVLLHFGETQKVARRRYREFVEKGIAQGRRPEFQGGGLVRSAGGKKAGLLGRSKEEREKAMQGSWGAVTLLTRFSVTPMNPMS